MDNESQVRSDEPTLSESSLNKHRERHKELSVTIRRTMLAMLAYSASCGVIIAQPDVPFVLTSGGVHIPVINVAVNLKSFLLVGPLGLIAITTYLHLFLAKLERITGLHEYDKQPFLFNFEDIFSRTLKFLIFYATPPIVLVGFSWKSAVIEWRSSIYFITMVVTVGMLLLLLRSRLKNREHILVIIGIVALLGSAFFSAVLGEYFIRNLNLKRANLAEIKFSGVDLTKANLQFANLRKSNLKRIQMNKAILNFSDLSRANLSGADLSDADLSDADLSGADLSGADLSDVDLSDADLSDAVLMAAGLGGADLRGAVLNRANLSRANLSDAYLNSANLRDANLSGADLRAANLSDADLKSANLSGVHELSMDQLCKAKTLYKSILYPEVKKQIVGLCPDLLKKP